MKFVSRCEKCQMFAPFIHFSRISVTFDVFTMVVLSMGSIYFRSISYDIWTVKILNIGC